MMKADVLRVQVDAVTLQECVRRITEAIGAKTYIRVVTANPEMLEAASRAQKLRTILNTADLVTADGVGVVWAARHLGSPLPERVTGIDLLEALFPVAATEHWRIFFLGSKPGVAAQAAARMAVKHPGFAWEAQHGYFQAAEEEALLERIRAFRPHLILIGLGAPRQEIWNWEHPHLAYVSMGVGGSFDALAGLVQRAPKVFREARLEWLYRLWQEPWRWRRQLTLPRFVLKVLRQKRF